MMPAPARFVPGRPGASPAGDAVAVAVTLAAVPVVAAVRAWPDDPAGVLRGDRARGDTGQRPGVPAPVRWRPDDAAGGREQAEHTARHARPEPAAAGVFVRRTTGMAPGTARSQGASTSFPTAERSA
nr:hypothetical protein [Pseudonocardia sp. HH130629-09]